MMECSGVFCFFLKDEGYVKYGREVGGGVTENKSRLDDEKWEQESDEGAAECETAPTEKVVYEFHILYLNGVAPKKLHTCIKWDLESLKKTWVLFH